MQKHINEINEKNNTEELNPQMPLYKDKINKESSINDNGQYEIIKKTNDLYLYKYKLLSQESIFKLITNHYYDNFDKNDIEKAFIILFLGKTGDGKTTAINALFNIIKGIKYEDKHRFILISEKTKKTGQAESQTDGIHLYYIKDYNNKPIIIIDSQGFGDTRGTKYDELLRETFEYTIKNIIKHINLVCIIAKSTYCRLDIEIKYIFSCVTSLFSKDFYKNFIFLTTFADYTSIEEGPIFIDSITKNNDFYNIISKFDEKWYYTIDSLYVLNKPKNEIAEYSFKQLNDLYVLKIKNSKNINIDESIKIINYRNQINNIINKIITFLKNIKIEKNKIKIIDDKIVELEGKISVINTKIENKNYEITQLYIPDKYELLYALRKKRDMIIDKLENEYEIEYVRKLKYDNNCHTYCNICKTNCHENCRCYLSVFILCNECIMFPALTFECKHCGHNKFNHTIRGNNKWVTERERVKINNDYKIEAAKRMYFKKYDEICDEYNSKVSEQNYKQKQLTGLYKNQSDLGKVKNKNIEEKMRLSNNIKQFIYEIKNNLMNLLEISNSLNNEAINNFHFKIENEFIDTLINRMQEINIEENEIKLLNEKRNYNSLYLEINNLSKQEVEQINDEQLLDKMLNIIQIKNN